MSFIKYFLLSLSLFLSLSTSVLAQNKTNFTRLTVKINGSYVRIDQTLEDDSKNIWMMTGRQLFKYDGYSYSKVSLKSIFNDKNKSDKLAKIIKDSTGQIWLHTRQGILARQNERDQFEIMHFDEIGRYNSVIVNTIVAYRDQIIFSDVEGDIFSINIKNFLTEKIISTPNYDITEIIHNNANDFFIKTYDNDIFAFSLEKRKLHKLIKSFNNFPETINFTVDKDNYLWVSTWGKGIFRFKFENNTFIEDKSYSTILEDLDEIGFISIFCDSLNNLYLGTDGNGLYKLDMNNAITYHFKGNLLDSNSLSTNTVLSINEDSNNNLWVLTNYGNVNVLPYSPRSIHYYSGSVSNLPFRVLSIYKSSSNELWMGTDGEGITKIDLKNANKKQYNFDQNSKKGLFGFAIAEDKNKNIWVGTYQKGLWIYSAKTDSFSKLKRKNNNTQPIEEVRCIFKDSKNRMWVSSDSALDLYTSNKELLASFPINSHGLKGPASEAITEDKHNNIWIVYNDGGLFKFSENSEHIQSSEFIKVPLVFEETSKLFTLASLDTYENDLWLIRNGKLYKYSIELNELTNFTKFNSLTDVHLTMVKVQDKDNIWLSSNKGIWHLNISDSVLINYQLADGFNSNAFMDRSAFKDNEGNLYFGGENGVNAFHPLELSKKNIAIKLNINSIEILNKPINEVIPEQIKDGINKIKKLRLENDQSSISFKFSAIGSVLDPNFFYAYRLEGIDKEWIYTENELRAVYTNLPAGKYKFKLRAGTKQGSWDIGTKEIELYVKNPLWLSAWAYMLYGSLLIIVLVFINKGVSLRKRLYKEEIKNDTEKKLHQLKMDFFTKMSHEIQTPLTLILGPIERLFRTGLNKDRSILEQRLRTVYNNANRLSRITSNLTMARNSEIGILKLNVFKEDLIGLLKEIGFSFEDHSNSKDIIFKMNFPTQKVEIWHDRDKIEHILYNLLSNAFKFTPKLGEVTLDLKVKKTFVEISISNTGEPIKEEELKKLFGMFYQSKTGRSHLGSGIGLSLTRELVELHHGTINVTSNAETTCFKVEIPLEDVYLKEEKLEVQKTRLNLHAYKEKELISNDDEVTKTVTKKDRTLLIVEDNYELQLFLMDVFKNNYNVIIAEDGTKGYEYAKQHTPNLILSDIIMPGISGIDLCKKVLSNKSISHIPIVLMTAENDKSVKLDGLKTGAVEFVQKPFNVNELVLKIKNIISTNEQIRDKFKRELISTPRVEVAKSDDELLLHRIVLEVENEIQNVDFNLLTLANKLKMSQTTLYRKCQALTGRTLVEFVRLIKLKKAAIILCKHEYSISETAYMVGFNDSKYFSKCFKKEFKVSPITFRKLSKEKEIGEFLNDYNLNDVV